MSSARCQITACAITIIETSCWETTVTSDGNSPPAVRLAVIDRCDLCRGNGVGANHKSRKRITGIVRQI